MEEHVSLAVVLLYDDLVSHADGERDMAVVSSRLTRIIRPNTDQQASMRFALTLASALVLLPAHLRAQAAVPLMVGPAQAAVGHRNPDTATLLGVLLPGGGQMYAGRTGKGIALLALSTGAVVAGAALSRKGSCSSYVPDPSSPIYIT